MSENTHHKEDLPLSHLEVRETFGPSMASPTGVIISVIVGCLIIAGSIFYNAKLVLNKMDGLNTNLSSFVDASQKQAQAQVQQQQAVAAAGQQGAPAPTPPPGPVNITLKPNTPFLGNANAKVTVVEYADYQCPFCEQFYRNTYPDIKSKYIDSGKIKFFYQDFAFLGPDSNTAAEASHCAADQNKFWQYHDYLFSHQGQEGSAWATADHQKQFAQAVGLNTTQFNSCLDSGKYKQEVLDETAAGKTYGVSGTPSVFVNGKILVGAQPNASFEQAIDAALK